MLGIKCIVRVTRPALTEQEREYRMKKVRMAMIELARTVEEQKEESYEESN